MECKQKDLGRFLFRLEFVHDNKGANIVYSAVIIFSYLLISKERIKKYNFIVVIRRMLCEHKKYILKIITF